MKCMLLLVSLAFRSGLLERPARVEVEGQNTSGDYLPVVTAHSTCIPQLQEIDASRLSLMDCRVGHPN